jgi:hypothetical protein
MVCPEAVCLIFLCTNFVTMQGRYICHEDKPRLLADHDTIYLRL